MNNTPDYDNNLAFEPELTWEELCEWAGDRAELGYFKSWFDMEYNDARFTFYNSGDVVVNGITIAELRTPEQMKTIIEALWG